MTIITKASAKNYFLTGNFPTQSNFADTIDSYLGLGETASQTVSGPLVFSGSLTFGSSITVSGDITATGGRITASAATVTSKLTGATALFTGIVSADAGLIAPTQATTDSSTNVATTAYVQAAKHYKTGAFNRDVSTASGTQAITGVGFTPKLVLFRVSFNSGGNAASMSWGEDDGVTPQCATNFTGSFAPTIDSSNSIDIINSGGNASTAKISSFGADGFTLAWVKTGSPTGILQVYFTAIG